MECLLLCPILISERIRPFRLESIRFTIKGGCWGVSDDKRQHHSQQANRHLSTGKFRKMSCNGRTDDVMTLPDVINENLSQKMGEKMDTSGIEPDPSRNSATMLSERDKPTTPCTHWITS